MPRGSGNDILEATLQQAPFWRDIHPPSLEENMRLQRPGMTDLNVTARIAYFGRAILAERNDNVDATNAWC
jgi:hypothetical protein